MPASSATKSLPASPKAFHFSPLVVAPQIIFAASLTPPSAFTRLLILANLAIGIAVVTIAPAIAKEQPSHPRLTLSDLTVKSIFFLLSMHLFDLHHWY